MISIIIVHYYTPDLLVRLLSNLQSIAHTVSEEVEIIVVNNGGNISNIDNISIPALRVIDLPENPGYATAINKAMEVSQGEEICVMNCDISITRHAFSHLLDALNVYDVVGPRLLMHDQNRFILPPVEPSSMFYRLVKKLSLRISFVGSYLIFRIWWKGIGRFVTSSDSFLTSRLSGALLMFKRKVFEVVGGFDERFRLYYEEVDWLKRVRKHGFRAAFMPEAEVVHFYNQSARIESGARLWFEESEQLFSRKWFPGIYNFLLTLIERLPAIQSELPRKCWTRKKIDNEDCFDAIEFDIPLEFGSPLYLLMSTSPVFVPSAILELSGGEIWRPDKEFCERMECGTYYFRIVDINGQLLPLNTY